MFLFDNFGCSIKEHTGGETIPPVVRQCIDYLTQNGKLIVLLLFFYSKFSVQTQNIIMIEQILQHR